MNKELQKDLKEILKKLRENEVGTLKVTPISETTVNITLANGLKVVYEKNYLISTLLKKNQPRVFNYFLDLCENKDKRNSLVSEISEKIYYDKNCKSFILSKKETDMCEIMCGGY